MTEADYPNGSSPIGNVIALSVLGIVLAFIFFMVWLTQAYMPAHNFDRCAQGYMYAADGQLCPVAP